MRIFRIIMILMLLPMFEAVASTPDQIDRGIELYNQGRWIDAQFTLRKAQKGLQNRGLSRDGERLAYYIAMCAYQCDNNLAQSYFDDFKLNYPESIFANEVEFAQAMLYCTNEEYAKAKEQLEKVNYLALNDKQREEYNIRMGYVLFLDNEYDQAGEYLRRINSYSELYHHALYYRSYINYVGDENSAARIGFESLQKNSDVYAAIAPYYILQIDFNDGKYNKVLNDGNSLISKSVPARKIELNRTLAEAAYKLEKYNEAISYLDAYSSLGGEMGRTENYIYGFSLYRTARYDQAAESLREVCGADDELTQNASYHLADCYVRLGKTQKAKYSFAMASNDKFNAQIAEDALFNYGKIEYESGNGLFNTAINVLTKYINKYPNTPRSKDARIMLVAAYYNSRDYEAAYNAIKLLDAPDADVRAAQQKITFFRGVEAYNRGDYTLAKSTFRESAAINISPKYLSLSYFWQGEIDFIEGNYDAALQNYHTYIARASKNDDEYGLALFNIGYCYLMKNSASEAIGYFKRYLSSSSVTNSYTDDANNRVGDILYSRRDFKNAKSYYSTASNSDGAARHYALYHNAIIEGVLENYTAKESALKTIINDDKGDYIDDAMYELGRTYVTREKYRDAITQLEAFIDKYPASVHYSQALSDLGLAYLNIGDRSQSIKYYDKAIKSAPNSSIAKDALQGVRAMYINSGDADGYFDYASSVGLDGDISSMSRDSLSFTSALQLYLHGKDDYDKAITSLKSYVNGYPNGYYANDALFYLSDCYLKKGDNPKALSTLTQLSDRGAGQYSEKVYDKLSQLTYDLGRYNDAAQYYRLLFETTESKSVKRSSLSGYAKSTVATNNTDEVIKMADYVISSGDAEPNLIVEVKYHKAKSLSNKGDRDKALIIYKELSADPNSTYGAESNYRIIESMFQRGDYDRVEDEIYAFAETGTRQNYWLARCYLLLGDVYIKRGDSFQARATLQSVVDGYSNSRDGIVDEAKSKIANLPQ